MTAEKTTDTPWHFWAMAVLMVLWNGLATVDYIMSVALGDAYAEASGMTEAQAIYFETLPLWVTAAWTVSVWCGAAAALFYVLRHRFAAILLTFSLAGTLGYIVHTYALSDGRAAMGAMWPMPAAVAGITACLVWYLSCLARRGVLR